MFQLLQLLGGGFYLLNKIFLSFSERSYNKQNNKNAKKWRIISWISYLAGLGPWVILFVLRHNWIAASVEASGAPAMILGLVLALRGTTKNPPRWLDKISLFCIPLGFIYSIYDFGGINTISQFLEIALVLGFLVGTYLLAKEKKSGYLWYILMHISCGWLMWIEGFPWLFAQQAISLVFIVDAFYAARKRRIECRV